MRRFILSVLLLTCIGLSLVFSRRGEVEEAPDYNPVTWSRFTDATKLSMLISGFGIESVIDLPASDLTNFKGEALPNCRYLGVASSQDEASALQIQYGSEMKSFSHYRVTTDRLPRADLLLCWDTLSTFSHQDIRATLVLFKKSGAKFLLMRHYPQVEENKDHESGVFEPVNWTLPPFQFPEPIIHLAEDEEGSVLSLWSVDTL